MQYPQVVDNGAIANTRSGQYGDPRTVRDDVVVDGRIITAENFDAARAFGSTIAAKVLAAAQPTTPPPPPPVNHAPTLALAAVAIPENSPLGTPAGQANGSDPDAGQTLSYAIVDGNAIGAFAINATTGVISVANSAALDFETTPNFTLTVQVTDNGSPALAAVASVTVQLLDVPEPAWPPVSISGSDLLVQGTPGDDTIYLWTGATGQFFASLNGRSFGPFTLPVGGRAVVRAGAGNDRVFATDSRRSVTIYGEAGHDQITGGWAGDLLDGGDGMDRILGMQGNDLIRGGAGNDNLDGREGDDIVLGDDGDDYVAGFTGRDLLVGGLGNDYLVGAATEDRFVQERTADDCSDAALLALLAEWTLR
jgi:Ca2+-binding RTX toxin-like protein